MNESLRLHCFTAGADKMPVDLLVVFKVPRGSCAESG